MLSVASKTYSVQKVASSLLRTRTIFLLLGARRRFALIMGIASIVKPRHCEKTHFRRNGIVNRELYSQRKAESAVWNSASTLFYSPTFVRFCAIDHVEIGQNLILILTVAIGVTASMGDEKGVRAEKHLPITATPNCFRWLAIPWLDVTSLRASKKKGGGGGWRQSQWGFPTDTLKRPWGIAKSLVDRYVPYMRRKWGVATRPEPERLARRYPGRSNARPGRGCGSLEHSVPGLGTVTLPRTVGEVQHAHLLITQKGILFPLTKPDHH